MAEIVNLFEVNIDTAQAQKDLAQSQREVEALKGALKDLQKAEGDNSEEIASLTANLKFKQSELRDNTKLTQSAIAASRSQKGSIEKLRAELAAVTIQWKRLSDEERNNTEDGKKLTAQKKALTDALKEEESATGDTRRNVGNYRDAIIEAVNELRTQQETLIETRRELEQNLKALEKGTEEYENMSQSLVRVESDLEKVNDQLGEGEVSIADMDFSLQGLIKSSEKSGGAFNMLKGGLKGATSGMLSFIKSSLAFIATPVGAVLAVIAGAFLMIKNAMDRNEEATVKIKKAFSGFTGVLKSFSKILEPIGGFLIDVLAKGIENIVDLFGKLSPEMQESIEQARDLTQAELELDKALRLQGRTQLEYQKRAEKLRQIRDNEKKSISERIEANEDLGNVLKEQLQEELKLAQKALEVANLRIKLDGKTKDNLDAQAEALTEIADIEERITGQQSEQLTNRVALEKEAAEQRIAIREAELDAFEKQRELQDKTLEDSVRTEREIAARKTAILKEQLNARLIEQQEYDAQLRSIRFDLKKSEIELEKKAAEDLRKIEEEQEELELAALERQFEREQAELDRQVENAIRSGEIEQERIRMLNEARDLDYENRMMLSEGRFFEELEFERQNLEAKRLQEVEFAEKIGADVNLINQKYEKANKELAQAEFAAKLSLAQGFAADIATIAGEATAVGKAAAASRGLTIRHFKIFATIAGSIRPVSMKSATDCS